MDVRLDDRVALITGGSRGIGLAIAQEMAASGARVMISSRKAETLEAAVATLDGEGAWFAANAGDPDDAQACVDATIERFGRIDILVNNAATNPYMGKTIDIDRARLDKTIAVNWAGPLLWTQLVWRASMQEHGGSVLNIASIGGMSVETSIGAYNATKAALLHLTRTLAAELAPGVRVNAIAPGLVKTDMARALWEPHEAAIAKTMPLQRLGEPADIARAAVFLCSDAASWITGSSLVIDGGALLHA
ncbi:MAG: SDR family oxidoreductase [Acidimicrobiia bacterium]|nr:SDR family oxidoreductase [Acidimicrobiia bacterium]